MLKWKQAQRAEGRTSWRRFLVIAAPVTVLTGFVFQMIFTGAFAASVNISGAASIVSAANMKSYDPMDMVVTDVPGPTQNVPVGEMYIGGTATLTGMSQCIEGTSLPLPLAGNVTVDHLTINASNATTTVSGMYLQMANESYTTGHGGSSVPALSASGATFNGLSQGAPSTAQGTPPNNIASGLFDTHAHSIVVNGVTQPSISLDNISNVTVYLSAQSMAMTPLNANQGGSTMTMSVLPGSCPTS